MLNKSKTYCVNKSLRGCPWGFFSPLDGWRWQAAGVLLLTQPPKQSKYTDLEKTPNSCGLNAPSLQTHTGFIVQLQYVAHYFIYAEGEEHKICPHTSLNFYLCEDTRTTSAFLQTRQHCNYLWFSRICLRHLHFSIYVFKFQPDWNRLLEGSIKGKKRPTPFNTVHCCGNIGHQMSCIT